MLLCISSSTRAQGGGSVILTDPQIRYPLDQSLEIFEDPAGKLTIDQISLPEYDARFKSNKEEAPNFGYTTSAIWIRILVNNETSRNDDWRLAFTNARMGLIDLYYRSSNDSVWTHQQAGSFLPATVREYAHPHFVFPISIQPVRTSMIYLRLQSNLPMRFSISLWSSEQFELYNHGFFSFIGIFYGMVGIMLVYNLLIYLFLRRVNYLYYFLFLTFYTLNTAASDGTANLFLFPTISLKYGVYGFATLAVVFCALFIQSFLELKQYIPWLRQCLNSLALIQVLTFLLYLFYPQAGILSPIIIILVAAIAILAAILVWRKGFIRARYFLIGWSVLLINAILLNATNVDVIQNYPLFDYGQYLSTSVLTIFLSLGLADQINVLRVQAERFEAASRESEERFYLLYEHAPVGIAISNSAGHIEQTNNAYRNLLGYDEIELHHRDHLELIHPEDRQISQDMFYQLVRGEQSYFETEARYIRKDSITVWVRRSVSALRDGHGNIHHTFAILNDISKLKAAEQELRHYSENLQQQIANRTRELERNQEQLVILNRASQAVNAAGLDLEKVYVAIRAASAWLVPAEVFAISMVDQAVGIFEDVFLAEGDRHFPGGSYPLENSFIGNMIKNGSSVKVDDFQTYPQQEFTTHWFGCCIGVRSGIAVLLRAGHEVMGVLSVQSYQPNAYQDSDLSILESFAAHASVAIENIHLHQQTQYTAVIEERQRLARELHDSVTQLLYSMTLLSGGWGLKASQGRLVDPVNSFSQIEELSLQALKEMRLLIHQLRPSILDEVGLIQAIQSRLKTVEQRVNVDARLQVEGDIPALTNLVEEEIYGIVQEALNNSLRHAHATAIQVTLKMRGKRLCIIIEDNGRGYDLSLPSTGMGTQSMLERAKMIGADLNIDSKLGRGTKIELAISCELPGVQK